MKTPILYSFRRCPYCIRAHMALKQSAVKIELREVKLGQFPSELSSISSAGTVPVLQLSDGQVISESWEIVQWALVQNDPEQWLNQNFDDSLIQRNDFFFKKHLDHYKYASRFPEHKQVHYRQLAEQFIVEIAQNLKHQDYLLGNKISVADIGIFPFIRQFSLVEPQWFVETYPNVQRWLAGFIDSELFQHIFKKQNLWQRDNKIIYI